MARARIRVGVWAMLLLSGCWGSGNGNGPQDAGSEEPDSGGGRGGQGGFGGFGGGSGFSGGRGGFGGFGGGGGAGFGGFGGSGGGSSGCPISSPACSSDNLEAVCGALVSCDLISGAQLTLGRCLNEINVGCASCVDVDNDDDAGVDCDHVLPDVECMQQCNLLIAPPANVGECREIVEAQPNTTEAYAECLCDQCFFPYEACIVDDGCWLVMQCAYDVDCQGMSCYAPNACMQIIDQVGATSISVALATELGNCSASFCEPTTIE